jgi:hypothetical protein
MAAIHRSCSGFLRQSYGGESRLVRLCLHHCWYWVILLYFKEFGGLSWSWSDGRWIYNKLCNRCLSPLTLWVRIPLIARCTTLCDDICYIDQSLRFCNSVWYFWVKTKMCRFCSLFVFGKNDFIMLIFFCSWTESTFRRKHHKTNQSQKRMDSTGAPWVNGRS